jgi:hypothetical protein
LESGFKKKKEKKKNKSNKLTSSKQQCLYTIIIYVKDKSKEIIETKSKSLLESLLNPYKIKIRIKRRRNELTSDFLLSPREKIVFTTILYIAYKNEVWKYPNLNDIYHTHIVSSNWIANNEKVKLGLKKFDITLAPETIRGRVMKNIEKGLSKIGAKDLIIRLPKGYTINGKVSIEIENQK